MNQIYCIFVVFCSIFYGICGHTFKQERAKVVYVNTKYMKDVTIFTFKESRRSAYLTSFNFTTLMPFADNVSSKYEFSNSRLQAFPIKLEMTTCEGFKVKWARDWLHTYTDIPPTCPMPARAYHATRFELPPKNFPLQFKNIDYTVKCIMYVTATREKICELSMELKFGKGG